MKILLASSNAHKVKELKVLLDPFEIYAFGEVITPFEIEENGTSFKENALMKSKAVFNALDEKQQKEFIVLSDDSGISVAALGGRPSIFSARFSVQKTDEANRAKLIDELKHLNLNESEAFYTACIGISSNCGDYSTHGFMYGKVITQEKGQNGFGYDSLFIPKGFTKTLGELDEATKAQISHRFKALSLAKILLRLFEKRVRQ